MHATTNAYGFRTIAEMSNLPGGALVRDNASGNVKIASGGDRLQPYEQIR